MLDPSPIAAACEPLPPTSFAAARLESLAQPCFPSRPGFEHQGVEDPSVSSESEDAVDTEGGKGQPDKRRRGRPKKHQDEASCSEGASPEDVYGGVGGVTRAGNVTAGAMEMLGASGGGVGLGWTGSALPVDLVKGAIPGSVVEVVPRADVWRLVPGARDRSHAARIIRCAPGK